MEDKKKEEPKSLTDLPEGEILTYNNAKTGETFEFRSTKYDLWQLGDLLLQLIRLIPENRIKKNNGSYYG